MKSIHDRDHKVSIDDFGTPSRSPTTVGAMVASMPKFLAANGLRELAAAIRSARDGGHPVVFAIGGHVIKTGCSPYIIDLMNRGIVTHVAMNGAAAIHDAEIAMHGRTSEDVDDTLRKGEFGMVSETMSLFDEAYHICGSESVGLGTGLVLGLGREMGDDEPVPYAEHSILCAVGDKDMDFGNPAITVHMAVGADTVHMSSHLDPETLGIALVADFRSVCKLAERLQGGVWVNIGSATLLPEVFLKAVSSAITAGTDLCGMTTADMDMIRHYRPTNNVVRRPPGRGVQLTGHHEVMLPLLHQLLI